MARHDRRGRHPLWWLECALVAIGAGLLGIAALGYVEASRAQAQMNHVLSVERASPARARVAGVLSTPFPWSLTIPRLGLSVAVTEGTGARSLALAAGHILGTRRPGQIGTVGIAAHRDTFFRPLRGIRIGDLVRIETPNRTFDYVVKSTKVVTPDDTGLLESTSTDRLVLVTCFPFTFIGAAPKRFLVVCAPIDSRSAQPS